MSSIGCPMRPGSNVPDPARCTSLADLRDRTTIRAKSREERPMPRTLKVRVDAQRCQGHARCNALAPKIFELDKRGHARPVGDGTVKPEHADRAWLAKANCPELAIDVTEE